MAIVYRTSDQVKLEEIDPTDAPVEGWELRKSFIAPFLQYIYYDQTIAKEVASSSEFALFTVVRGKLNYIVIAGNQFRSKEDTKPKVVRRVFQVSKDMLETTADELSRNRGVLNSEYDRIHAVTDNFRYSPVLDMQKDLCYATEDQLPNAHYEHIQARNKKDIIALNKRLGTKPNQPGYALTAAEAAELGEEIIEAYGLTKCRVEIDPMYTSRAAARCMARAKRVRLFTRDTDLRVQFSAHLPIFRGIELHEFAHAIDIREFGSMCHGPTFMLVYCELLSKYTDLNFVSTYNFFVKRGLKVANPIHSDKFGEFGRTERNEFRRMEREVRNKRLGE